MSKSSPTRRLVVLPGSTTSSDSNVPKPSPPSLSQRAEMVAQQMRYFAVVSRKCSFDELFPSAHRAGFTLLSNAPQEKEAHFRWPLGQPDCIFSLSFKDPEKVAVVAESQGDISGLVLVGHSHVADISVEIKPWLGGDELGPNAIQFRETLLTFPGFIETPAWANY